MKKKDLEKFDYVLTIQFDELSALLPDNWVLIDSVGVFNLYSPVSPPIDSKRLSRGSFNSGDVSCSPVSGGWGNSASEDRCGLGSYRLAAQEAGQYGRVHWTGLEGLLSARRLHGPVAALRTLGMCFPTRRIS